MAVSQFPVAPPGASTTSLPLAARVAELEGMVERLVDVQAGLVDAIARLTPLSALSVGELARLKVVR